MGNADLNLTYKTLLHIILETIISKLNFKSITESENDKYKKEGGGTNGSTYKGAVSLGF